MDSLAEFPVYAVLPCSDFERARAWYEEKLGLRPASDEMPGNGWYECGNGPTGRPGSRTPRATSSS